MAMPDKNEQPNMLSQLIPTWIRVAGLIALLCLGAILVDLLINPFPDGNEPIGEATEEIGGEADTESNDQTAEDASDAAGVQAASEVPEEQNGDDAENAPETATENNEAASAEPTEEIATELAEETPTPEPTPEPIVQFESVEYEAVEGQGEVFIEIVVDGTIDPKNPVEVDIIIDKGDDDPEPVPSGEITESPKEISMEIPNDDMPGPGEEWELELSEPKNARLDDEKQTATLIIVDDDATVGFTATDVQKIDEERGQKTIEVELKGQSTKAITVDYEIGDSSSAEEDKHYSFGEDGQTLTFEPGDTTKHITLNIIDNNEIGDKNIILILSNAIGAEIDPDHDRLELIINDDDVPDDE